MREAFFSILEQEVQVNEEHRRSVDPLEFAGYTHEAEVILEIRQKYAQKNTYYAMVLAWALRECGCDQSDLMPEFDRVALQRDLESFYRCGNIYEYLTLGGAAKAVLKDFALPLWEERLQVAETWARDVLPQMESVVEDDNPFERLSIPLLEATLALLDVRPDRAISAAKMAALLVALRRSGMPALTLVGFACRRRLLKEGLL